MRGSCFIMDSRWNLYRFGGSATIGLKIANVAPTKIPRAYINQVKFGRDSFNPFPDSSRRRRARRQSKTVPGYSGGRLKEARYKIIQNDRFSWKKSRTNISLWWFKIYQNDIRLPCYFFCYMHLKVAGNSILALKSVFIYDVIISCLKAWYIQLTSKNLFYSKDNYFYLHNSHISVNCNW